VVANKLLKSASLRTLIIHHPRGHLQLLMLLPSCPGICASYCSIFLLRKPFLLTATVIQQVSKTPMNNRCRNYHLLGHLTSKSAPNLQATKIYHRIWSTLDPTQGKNGEITYLLTIVHGLKSDHWLGSHTCSHQRHHAPLYAYLQPR